LDGLARHLRKEEDVMRTITSISIDAVAALKRALVLSLGVTIVALGLLSLSACNTTAGLGRDVSKVGRKIEHEANEHR
jgi:predicted small secreted protein/ElaB/YqjD/DUF883 family membrane-anchored ribosome-binding protein